MTTAHPDGLVLDLDAIRKAMEAAAPRPWGSECFAIYGTMESGWLRRRDIAHTGSGRRHEPDMARADATLIVLAVNSLPALLARALELTAAKAESDALRARLKALEDEAASVRRDLAKWQNKAVDALKEKSDALDEAESFRVALTRILKEPYGCRFCDSGKLRNERKPHDVDCGYELARAAGRVSDA